MRIAIPPLAIALLFVGTAARATGSVDCGTTDGSNIDIIINTDRDGPAGQARGATLTMNGRTLATADAPPTLRLGRSLLNRDEVRVELLAANEARMIAVLLVRVSPGDASTGTLTIEGRRHPVSCEFG
jgi:hypothetical protein